MYPSRARSLGVVTGCPWVRRGARLGGALSLLVMALAGNGQAQQGSRLLEPGHWAYEYLWRLRGAGYLDRLDLLQEPLTRREIAHALAQLGPDTLPEPEASWVRVLRREFAPAQAPSQGTAVGGLAWVGARAATTQRLDAARAVDSGGSVWPRAEGGAWFQSGPLTVESRVLFDAYLKHEPDGRAPGLRVGGISDHTYLSVSAGPADFLFGRFQRNWAPPGVTGLLLSDNPLAYPQLGVNVRLGRIGLQVFTAELDTLGSGHRYLAGNRVAYTGSRLMLALTESLLYSAGSTGPSLQLMNPFTVLLFEHENPPAEDRAENLMLGAQFWYRMGSLDVYGDGLLDDIDLRPDSGRPRAPTRYGVTLGARWRPLGPRWEARAEYQRVSSYAYRTYRLQDLYDYLGRGLGTNFADYDQLSVAVDVFPPVGGLRVTPAATWLRQGQGDFRVPFPPDSVFLAGPELLLGVTERTIRVALRGRYQPRRPFWISWDIGQNFLRNAGHVTGPSTSRFAALGEVGVRLEFGPAPP